MAENTLLQMKGRECKCGVNKVSRAECFGWKVLISNKCQIGLCYLLSLAASQKCQRFLELKMPSVSELKL